MSAIVDILHGPRGGIDNEQINYRLAQACGEQHAHDAALEHQFDRLRGEYGIERIGRGWSAFGRDAGTPLDNREEVDEVRAIMAGVDPATGRVLLKPKLAVAPSAKLSGREFVEALHNEAQHRGTTAERLLAHDAKAAERFARLERMLVRQGQSHRAPVADLEQVATAAGMNLEQAYDAQELASARTHANDRVAVGCCARDLVLTRPRTPDGLTALLPEEAALRMDQMWMDSVRQGVQMLEDWCAYGMAGHHGNGQRARRVETTGWASTITWHRTTRSINGGIGDPHFHAHVLIPNLVYCPGNENEAGKWRAVANGGRDLYRHCQAVSEMVLALYRYQVSAEYGAQWEWRQDTRQWEIKNFPEKLRRLYCRRSAQIEAEVGAEATPGQRRAAGKRTAGKKVHSTRAQERAFWRERAEQSGFDVDQVIHDVLGYDPPEDGLGPVGAPPPSEPDLDAMCARVWDPETGVTASEKTASEAQIMAHVARACPTGLPDTKALQTLTERVLASDHAVAVPGTGHGPLRHNRRFTSSTIVQAERTIITSATERLAQGAATVPAHQVQTAIAAFTADRGHALDAEQDAVVRRLTGAGHGVEAVVGIAGSGKTTVMDAAHRAWKAAGLSVHGAATAAVAAAKLRAESGMSASTVAAQEQRITAGTGLEGVDVLVVDEAAMLNDLALADLTVEAARTGTKLVMIGDPKQFRAIGPGGAFKRVHELVGGLTLTHNRRQSDPVERVALQIWREGEHATTLAMWAETGRVVATDTLSAAYASMVAAWWTDRAAYTDVHDALDGALMLAATNDQVEALNERARVVARHDGQLQGEDVEFWLSRGDRLHLAVGDLVRVRKNDYRQGEEDVLNGYRGRIVEVDARRGALVEWRQGTTVTASWIRPEKIAGGHLSHAYALTIAAAQGLTVDTCHTLGLGADAHAVYPALARPRERSSLYLPAAELEPETIRRQLGEARTDAERLDRVLAAYAPALVDEAQGMVTDRIDGRQPVAADPEPVMRPTLGQARAGQGPTMAEAQDRLEELRREVAIAQERVNAAHTDLVQASTRTPRRWGRRAAERRVDDLQGVLDQERARHQDLVQQLQQVKEQAIAADVAIARHSAAAPRRPVVRPRGGGALDPAARVPTATGASPAPTPAERPVQRPRHRL
ncbi:AAA family ATPase [Nocardiopsis aegyptia]|uniref:AAA family ATPase n=1 Tax=Nocardiopsis aegyptia TaxID=220378 RepID=UPI00366DC8B7